MKNLKMFAIAVMAFAVMAMGVHAVSVPGQEVEYTKDNVTVKTTLTAALAAAPTAEDTLSIKLLDNVTLNGSTATAVNGNVTIDLNGKTITIANTSGNTADARFEVAEGATLNLTGKGTITDNAANVTNALIKTEGTLVVGENVTIETKGTCTTTCSSAVNVAGDEAVVTIKGTLSVNDGNALNVLAAADGAKVTIADGAKVESSGAKGYGIYVQGDAEVTVNKATVEGAVGISAEKGTVTVNGATIKGTATPSAITSAANSHLAVSGSAIQVIGADEGAVTLVVNSGDLESKKGSAVSVYSFGDENILTEDSSLKGGNYSNGKDKASVDIHYPTAADGAAVTELLNAIKGILVGGNLGEKPLSVVLTAGQEYDADAALKVLAVAGADLGNSGTTEPGQPGTTEPGTTEPGNQGPTDNVSNPNTNDNILVYAGLGLVSLTSVAFTARKRED